MPAVMPGRALAGERALGEVRQGAAAPQGPQRPRLLLRPDARGGRHRPRAARGALVPRPADEPLPDPGEVPGRGAAALRAHARPRVHHEGRVLVPRRPRRRASASTRYMYDDLHAHLRALRPRRSAPSRPDTGAIGGSRRTSSRCSPTRARTRSSSATRCGYAANVEKAEVRAASPPRRRPARRARARRDARAADVEEVQRVPRRCRRSASSRRWSTDRRRRRPWSCSCAATTRCPRRSSRPRSAARRSRSPTSDTCERVTGAPVGFAGPVGLARAHRSPTRRCAARAAWRAAPTAPTSTSSASITARDFAGAHVRRPPPGARRRPLPALRSGTLRAPPRHRGRPGLLPRHQVLRGDEARRSSAPTARSGPIEMGCYGIGVTRTIAAAIEQHHDDAGIIWPAPLAPFGGARRAGERRRRRRCARPPSASCSELERPGVDVLLDDRDERPGRRSSRTPT